MEENNILEEYYREIIPSKRKLLLEQLLAAEDCEANRLRREIYELRYDKKSRKDGEEPADRFLAFWMLLKVSANNCGGLFGARSVRKSLTKELDKLGITRLLAAGELERELLYREFYHLTVVYITYSRTDRSYGSAFLGLVAIKDDQIRAKLAEDVYAVSVKVPRAAKMEEQFALFAKAARAAFIELLPEDRRYLDELIFEDQK